MKRILSKILKKTTKTRTLFFLISDIFLIASSFILAFLLRFEGQIPVQYFEGSIQVAVFIALVFCIPIFYFSKLYSFTWAYVSTQELITLFRAVSIGFLALGATFFIFRDYEILSGFPRSVLVISYFLVFVSTGSIRFSKRIYLNIKRGKGESDKKKRTLIVGAGDAGEQILRSILISKSSQYFPVGFVDDSQIKQGVMIHGLKVFGKIEDIPNVVESEGVEEMIIALPSAGSKIIKRAVELGRQAGISDVKIVPSIAELIGGEVSIGNIREVEVEDLLGREPVSVDMGKIENFIENKIVLITGAAGSIGSELARQVIKFKPLSLLLFDQDETGIFYISNELKNHFPNIKIVSIIADIRDKKNVDEIFCKLKPSIVFHAAAYKHVPLMEENSQEAVRNNIFGMKIISDASLKNGVEKFVFISTDKAINPTSVMGATKRVGEMICQVLNQQNGTKFISVRFGNVLGSRGSVIPVFKKQIKQGGPVKVTHPDMKRFFMITSEACLLVMQAAEMGQGGEVFVLDMGEPVKILDLAKEMIKLSGFEPDKDISIVFTELRPGEKMFEEILTAEEGTVVTKNEKIFIARLSNTKEDNLNKGLEKLDKVMYNCSNEEVKAVLNEIVPTYKNGESIK
ncbi:MAG: nucleoside-diphosphate sugar epimerase/dehydratase [Patescibacteria group bacterium]|nr:nucleoside-diphosphate sugar epimerase/dehydratase [Patescibacteria group bacterium]